MTAPAIASTYRPPLHRPPSVERIGARYLRELIRNKRPKRVSRMQPKGSRDKYLDLPPAAPLTDQMLADHMAGRATFAVTIGTDGQTHETACDVDHVGDGAEARGRADLLALLAEAKRRGRTAYTINVNTPGGHCGGHFRMMYSGLVSARDAAAEMRDIARAAGLPEGVEIWPGTRQPLRLPFGYHEGAESRGEILLQSGEILKLDQPDELAAAVAAVVALPRNTDPPPAPAPEPTPRPAPRPVQVEAAAPRDGERLDMHQLIDRFNSENLLPQLVERYGGHKTRDGFACNCGVPHSHETQLQVLDRGMVSYSTRCRWAPHYSSGRATDSFGLYTIVEHHGDKGAALRALRQQHSPSTPRRGKRYDGPELPQPSAAEIERRQQEAARKREQRRQHYADTLASVQARLAGDWALTDRDVLIGLYLLDRQRVSFRVSIDEIVNATGYGRRSVAYALEALHDRDYLSTEAHTNGKGQRWAGGYGEIPRRTFLMQAEYRDRTAQTDERGVQGFLEAEPSEKVLHPSIIYTCTNPTASLTCEPAPHPAPSRLRTPATEPDGEPGYWQALCESVPTPDEPDEPELELRGVLLLAPPVRPEPAPAVARELEATDSPQQQQPAATQAPVAPQGQQDARGSQAPEGVASARPAPARGRFWDGGAGSMSRGERIAWDAAAAMAEQQRVAVPPADPAQRRSYEALRGKACKVAATNPAQARALDARADALCSWVLRDDAAARPAARDVARERANQLADPAALAEEAALSAAFGWDDLPATAVPTEAEARRATQGGGSQAREGSRTVRPSAEPDALTQARLRAIDPALASAGWQVEDAGLSGYRLAHPDGQRTGAYGDLAAACRAAAAGRRPVVAGGTISTA